MFQKACKTDRKSLIFKGRRHVQPPNPQMGQWCGYQNFAVQIIKQVKLKTFENLARREQWWQNQLRVYVQNGHKNHCYRKEIT